MSISAYMPGQISIQGPVSNEAIRKMLQDIQSPVNQITPASKSSSFKTRVMRSIVHDDIPYRLLDQSAANALKLIYGELDHHALLMCLIPWVENNLAMLPEYELHRRYWSTDDSDDASYFWCRSGDAPLRILSLLYNAALMGDKTATSVMIQIFHSAYPEEYDWLKRQKVLEISEAPGFTFDCYPRGIIDIYVTMSRIMNVSLGPDETFLKRFNKPHSGSIRVFGDEAIISGPSVEAECPHVLSIVRTNQKKYKKTAEKYFDENREELLEHFKQYNDYICSFMTELATYERPEATSADRDTFADTYSRMRRNSIRVTSPDQLALFHAMESGICHVYDRLRSRDRAILEFIGLPVREEDAPVQKDPHANVLRQESAEDPDLLIENRGAEANSDDREMDPEEKIRELQRKVSDLQYKLQNEHQKTRSLREELEAEQERGAASEKYIANLEHMLEIAVHDTEEETVPIEQVKAFLKQKNVCVIGGHENWVKKLRAEFPNWRYIRLNGFQMTDADKVLRNYDMNIMFTDHLDHCTYGKMMNVIREKELPLGYVTTVNLDRCMRQIYQAFTDSSAEQTKSA